MQCSLREVATDETGWPEDRERTTARSLAVLLVAACARSPTTTSEEPAASIAPASAGVATPGPGPSPVELASGTKRGFEPANASAPEGRTDTPEVAAVRAWAAAHPEDVPTIFLLAGFDLVLLRRSADATLCVVGNPDDDGPEIDPVCAHTAAPIDDLRLLATDSESWIAFAGGIFVIGDDGVLVPRPRGPRGRWRTASGATVPTPRRARTAPILEVTPSEGIPLAELIDLHPEPIEGADAAWTSDTLLCLRVDAVWRCASPAELGERWPTPRRALAPVHGGSRTVIPLVLSRDSGGSELSESTSELVLLEIVGATWSFAASLPLGAEVDEHLRQLDDDDNGARVVGSIESYRWRYVVETPGCVRFAELDRAAESYAHHFRDGRDRSKRHPKPPPAGLAPAPDELPRRASAIDPYVDPADLRGRWELRGERWLPVAECAL